jgi:membrane protease subunit HflK
MYPPGGPQRPEINFDQILGGVRSTLGRITGRLGGGGVGLLVVGVIALIVIVWAASGIYTINPGEQAALRLFGKVQQPTVVDTGLHWWWPGPVGKKNVLLVNEVRRMELGFRGAEGVADSTVPDEALMISGDLSIVDVSMVVQYDIKDLVQFLFRVNDPGEVTAGRNIPEGQPDGRTLKDAAEAALRLVVGQRPIGDVLAEERIEIEAATKLGLQDILDSYGTGINVVSVALLNVQAPEEVRAAFNDVLQARQDKITAVNQAQAYENQVIPEARGQAEQIIQPAEAFKQARIARAQGEADQFTSVLFEYAKSRTVTRQRLYLEAMEDILPGINKIIVSPEAESVLILGGQEGLTPIPLGPNP